MAVQNLNRAPGGVQTVIPPRKRVPVVDDSRFQRRVLAATIDDVRVVNLYIPNGSEVGSEKDSES